MANEVHQIAVGTNNLNVVPFYRLNPPLFRNYPRAITQTWIPYVGRKLLGTRLAYKSWGKPALRLTFGQLTRDEIVYLSTWDGAVTIFCLNESINFWGTYNGVWLSPTLADIDKQRKLSAPYSNVTYNVIDLSATT